MPSEQQESVFVCRREEEPEEEEGIEDGVCIVCVSACHFALDSYAVVRRAECCEIYNYCGVPCYDSGAASADSTSQRWSALVCVCTHTRVRAFVCANRETAHSPKHPRPPLACTQTHAGRRRWGQCRFFTALCCPPVEGVMSSRVTSAQSSN